MKTLNLEGKSVKMLDSDDEFMHGRDNSGGSDFDSYRAHFGDGGRTTGLKRHLAASGNNSERTFTNPNWQSEGGDVPGFENENAYVYGDPVRVAKASFHPGYDIELQEATPEEMKRGYR